MGQENTGASIESRKDFDKTPKGQYQFYSEELGASQHMLEKWHKQADKIVNRYIGKRSVNNSQPQNYTFDLNLFHSNVQTLGSMLYGNTPKIDVSRRYADANDDVGRVAAEMMERLLNLDVAENGAETDAVFRAALSDRLLSGLGVGRVRYELETDDEDNLVSEEAPIDYFFWGDVLWSWARNFTDIRWIAFRNYLTKDEIEKRFTKHAADNIPLKKQKMSTGDESDRDPNMDGPWMKGEIWEIWDKTTRKVVYMAFGYQQTLEIKDDPLQLAGFFPVPPFFIANPTTSLYAPTPDFTLAQDLYNEIDKLQERISIITDAVKVVGVYDAAASEVGNMFKQGMDNDLIPVDNWALFAEKGGLRGTIEWVPLADVVNALDKLISLRDQNIQLLQQITGMSDIMRGGLDSAYEGVGQSEMKAKFGSIRVQALQDQFARFASDLMQIKAEVISRHFSPETIVQKSNMGFSPDRELILPAVELIKQPEQARLRVDIRPESVAMVDYAQLKNERTEYINALSTFMQSAAPLMESDPNAKPFLLQLLQWGLAGFKGASEIEGVIDKAIEASQQEAQQGQKPDPAAQAAQMQMQMQMQMEQMKQQGEMQKIQAKAQADMQIRSQDLEADIQTAMAQSEAKKMEAEAVLQATLAEIQAKMLADITVEQAQSEANATQAAVTAQTETQKNVVSAELDMAKEAQKSQNKINEIGESAKAKIKEAKAKPATKPQGGKSDAT